MMPPIKSQRKAGFDRISKIGLKAIRQVQPIAMYTRDETHFGPLTQKPVIIIPIMARSQIKINKNFPTNPFRAIMQIGV